MPHPLRFLLLSLLFAASGAHAASQSLDYVVNSHGLHLADITVRTSLDDRGYAITVHSRSTGLLGALFRSDVTSAAAGRFEATRAVPTWFQSAGHSRGADRLVRIEYADSTPTVRALRPAEPEREPVPAAATIGSIDLLSAMVALVRQVGATGQCGSASLVFDGRRLSRLEARQGPLEAGGVRRCDFVSLQLGGFLRDDDRARTAPPLTGSVWLARPAPDAPMVAMRAVLVSARYGSATLLLVQPAASSPRASGSTASGDAATAPAPSAMSGVP